MPETQGAPGAHGRASGHLDHLLDVGPLARAVAARVGASLPRGARAPAVAAAITVMALALLAAEGLEAGPLAVASVLFVALTGAAWSRPVEGRLAWLYPALLRAAEYGFVVRAVAVLEPDALPAAYTYLLVVAYHHYDTVYRLRHTGSAPAGWATAAAGGYDGRLLAVAFLALAGVLEPGLWLLAVGLGAIVVGESGVAWTGWLRLQRAGAQEGGPALS